MVITRPARADLYPGDITFQTGFWPRQVSEPIKPLTDRLDAVLAAGVVLEAITSGRAHTCACSRAQSLNVVGAAPVTAHVVGGGGVACGPSVCACDDVQGIT